MRSFPAILLAALTVVAIAATVVLTAAHFGMRDWPTPPMPDTATRLITPTEAATKARERLSDGDDPVEIKIAGDAGADADRSERPARDRSSRRAESTRRRSSRRGERNSRRSGQHHSGGRSHGGDDTPAQSGDDASTPAQSQPMVPQATPAAPVTQAHSGEQSQARPDEPATAPATPPPSLDPVLPQLPSGGSGDDAPSGQPGSPGHGHGHGNGRGPIGNLLDALL